MHIKKYKKISTLFLLIFAGFSISRANIIREIESIKQVQDELAQVDENTLVVFDMDNTLLMANAPILTIDQATTFRPVEKETVKIIKNLQARRVPVIALTYSGSTPEIRRWRASNLHQIKLNFANSFTLKEFEFNMFPIIFDAYPAFYHGILCAGGAPKGLLLAAFINKIGWRPKKVIFFDDQFPFCLNVHLTMVQWRIPVQCYWYRAAYKKMQS